MFARVLQMPHYMRHLELERTRYTLRLILVNSSDKQFGDFCEDDSSNVFMKILVVIYDVCSFDIEIYHVFCDNVNWQSITSFKKMRYSSWS